MEPIKVLNALCNKILTLVEDPDNQGISVYIVKTWLSETDRKEIHNILFGSDDAL